MSKGNIMNTYGRFDVVFEKGLGCKLYDDNGNEYLDFVSGVAVNCLGHSHPAIINAINEQAKDLMHISNYYWSKQGIELSERLCSLGDHKSVFFCNSGTEAMECGIKIGRKYGKIKGGEKKNIVIYMENSFHGRTMGALTVTGQKKYQEDFMPLIGGVRSAKFNDIEDLKNKMDNDVCAIILEPVQGEGGINPVMVEYLEQVKELCEQYDALLIFDEIQCGVGRLGTFFAYQTFNVIPDVICMAKGIAGGFPMGAIMTNEKASVLVPGDHGSTFGGNPLACAVSLAVLGELVDGGVVEKVKEKSEYMISKLNELKDKYSQIEEIKGIGLLLGIKLNVDIKEFSKKCFENKLLAVTAGKDVVRLLPPLNVEKEDMDKSIELLEKVLKSYNN
ncbi:aspartate aminotransferase family protein [Clostridiaceae bacterium UIB06]|uniref:Acetylornithine aminotransferase n=1 Tax=Clostridium thailandense TaxID=2794346 RepID=A0A949TZF3_9CLOT|nr:aspartate aminotransferase family protein [Clostridium thailandense]MBV7274450.1 aspartate aminotransferase family protein [Clostridium thailandense]MCH5136636.1 aspartate aminotransferase family protein [Clostridiaceae bacterium UIB06]